MRKHKDMHSLRLVAVLGALLVTALPPAPSHAQAAPGPTLSAVRAKGRVDCSTSLGTPGFSAPDSQGVYRGLDSDFCRAVAAAVFGDASKARFTPLAGPQRLPAV
jgi:general L-amino acid transport system substrate-binding protein